MKTVFLSSYIIISWEDLGLMLSGKTVMKFKRFRERLYKGDDMYVATAEFILDMLLKGTTQFARECEILPIAVTGKSGSREAQCLFIRAPRTDFAQIAFFDCLEGCPQSAAELICRAKNMAKERGLKRLVAGLNAHLSYGVGILTCAELKNTFDTCYNKLYYADYFSGFAVKNTLTAYRNTISDASRLLYALPFDLGAFTVREANFAHFEEECEVMRGLCEMTIGNTYLYVPTSKGHFYELMKDLRVLLSGKNLLFLMHGGKEVGFLFWHPDFNCAVNAGKDLSEFSFALSCVLKRRLIDTVKLNAIGVTDDFRGLGTIALLRAMAERIRKYRYIETNFVWDCNIKSSLLNKKLMCGECRKFAVYEDYL